MDEQKTYGVLNEYTSKVKRILRELMKTEIIFRPTDNIKVRWDLLIMILALYNCYSVPVEMSFDPPLFKDPRLKIMNFAIDFIFFLDILVCFRTVYINDVG